MEKNQNVAKCYKNLFKRKTADDFATYMTRIIDKVWASKTHTKSTYCLCNKCVRISFESVRSKGSSLGSVN